MPSLSNEQKQAFRDFLVAAKGAAEDIRFILQHSSVNISVDQSEKSLEQLEDFYRAVRRGEITFPPALVSSDELISVLCRYLGQCIVNIGARWVQSSARNRMFGQPCLEFPKQPQFTRMYPVQLAIEFETLSMSNPQFPGLREGRVLAEQYRIATKRLGLASTA